MIAFENKNKNPNELHDFLIINQFTPISLTHNAEYNENGEKTQEATEIYIEIESEREQELTDLVNQFMADLVSYAS